PGQAKKMGRTVTMRKGWDQHKADVMLGLLRQKFQDPSLRERLLATGTQKLVEGNSWHDNLWGSCGCTRCKDKGKNLLGRLLMQVRAEIQEA
ncbi:MAG: NADAR family protein, partial [Candidatus Portnoybacteria bacterium]|nr:NADAR family protein [Candidatus Portnoybacteria bacterium]